VLAPGECVGGLEYGVAFNEFAAFEAGSGADERDEVECVDGAPAFLGGVDQNINAQVSDLTRVQWS
jgi:hypothetical protein